jgi:hypothetical protein
MSPLLNLGSHCAHVINPFNSRGPLHEYHFKTRLESNFKGFFCCRYVFKRKGCQKSRNTSSTDKNMWILTKILWIYWIQSPQGRILEQRQTFISYALFAWNERMGACPICLHVSSKTVGRIMIKFGMDIMPLETTPNSCFNILQSIIPTWRAPGCVRWEQH